MASILKVDKLDPQSGTALEIGTSGDTISIPSGATLDISASTLTPPATMPASSGVNLTALNATQLTSGTVPTARLGSGTASSTTILYGDQTYKTEPSTGGQYQLLHTTYDCSTTGALAITGSGFTPKFIYLWYNNGSWVAGRVGMGMADGTSSDDMCSFNDGNQQTSDSWKFTTGNVQDQIFSSSNYSYLVVASFDADGLTLTKSKFGSPTGTIGLNIACFG